MRTDAPNRPAFALRRAFAAVLIGPLLTAGCGSPPPPFLETVRIDEPLSDADVTRLAAVLEAIGEDGRRRLPSPFLPAPAWAAGRTLPVRELAAAEQEAAEKAWSPEAAAKRLDGPAFDNAANGMTREQLCAFVLSIGAAASRERIVAGTDLADLARRSARKIAELNADPRPFASLSPEDQADVLRQAAWLAIGNRAARLATVPEENVALAARHRDRLAALLPAVYFRDPFAGLHPRPEDHGIPFTEGGVSDRDLAWRPAAIAESNADSAGVRLESAATPRRGDRTDR